MTPPPTTVWDLSVDCFSAQPLSCFPGHLVKVEAARGVEVPLKVKRVRLPGRLNAISGAHCGRNCVSFMTEKLKSFIVFITVHTEHLQFSL